MIEMGLLEKDILYYLVRTNASKLVNLEQFIYLIWWWVCEAESLLDTSFDL